MMKKLLLIVFWACGIASGHCQDITRRQADHLLKIVAKEEADTTHIHALLTLAEFNIFKKGELKADLDSARAFIKQAKILNSTVKSISAYGYTTLVESYLERETKHEDIAKVLNDRAIQLLKEAKSYYHLGQAYYQRATYYDPDDESVISKTLPLYQKGIEAFKQVNNIERQAYGYKRRGESDSTTKKSMEDLQTSLSLYRSIHYQAVQEVYDLIAEAYMTDVNFQQALAYELLALKIAEVNKDTSMELCAINNHIGLIFYNKHDYKTAVIYFLKALKTAEIYNEINTIDFLCGNIVNSYINSNQPIDAKKALQHVLTKHPIARDDIQTRWFVDGAFTKIYTMLNQIDKGRPYAEDLRMINLKYKDKLTDSKMIEANNILSGYYLIARTFGKATYYMRKNEELVPKIGSIYQRSTLYKLKFRIDSATGNYRSALKFHLYYDKIQDSIFNETKAIEFQKQQVQYETEKKDQQIKLLKQNELLQQSELKHSDLVKNITTGGILVMLIISALIYRIYKQKKAANDIITHRNELLQQLLTGKEWLLKEIHHRVKNNLHTVISLLESQAAYLENDALKAIENSKHRIYAMSLIHQKLYQSEDIKTINMASYIPELVQSLRDSFESASRIKFVIKVEKIELGLSHAIPLGLILNEAVTNSIKYAFPGGEKGIIHILMFNEAGSIKMEITDNGIGMPQANCDHHYESLGLKLIKGLSDDIEAKFSCETLQGTKITIIFKIGGLDEPHPFFEFADNPRPAFQNNSTMKFWPATR